ncbi:unnamed protein product [Rotaria sp. Silwood1]|nr:unnamed protein product [Rotaria sp. Silwood1]CAF0740956.1 unnamed protein product [Rotaria sp. Silwood1]CAF3353968.1 unnamed protein product [Rotaria sp. Silwood1]CAF3354916.1 unnamed protein product [Rotaria sp. Silwood1]CAF4544983.1 unnamed protein product [Rotaria sp. Silwood1]
MDYFYLLILLINFIQISSTTKTCYGPYVTASSLEELHQDIHLVEPLPIHCGGLSCEFYLSPSSALGSNGPLSAYGPLGIMGPIGHSVWNPTAWRFPSNEIIDWATSDMLFGLSNNPLSSAGPLSSDSYHKSLPSINDFGKHLQALGLWGALGPLGPLGALGPLGPLGPTGPHNTMNLEGHHSVSVKWTTNEIHDFDLVEVLDESRANEELDCSFMIFGVIRQSDETDSYYFNCKPNQFVTIVLVPEHSLDYFNMTLFSNTNSSEKIASSDSMNYINFIQLGLMNNNNGTFRIDVSLHEMHQFILAHSYRLIVTGSHDLLDLKEEENNIKGPHIITC